jgi:hypothetical protein
MRWVMSSHFTLIVWILQLIAVQFIEFDYMEENCESFAIQEYPMIPKPKCWVETDPNKYILISIEVQVIVLFILILIISGFVLIHIKNIWVSTKPETNAFISLYLCRESNQ